MVSPYNEEKSSTINDYNKTLNDMIYTYEAHHYDGSISKLYANFFLWLEIGVTTASFISSINDIIKRLSSDTTLTYYTTGIIFSSLVVIVINSKLNYNIKSNEHHETAHKIKSIINRLKATMRNYELKKIDIHELSDNILSFETEFNDVCLGKKTTTIAYKLACRRIEKQSIFRFLFGWIIKPD